MWQNGATLGSCVAVLLFLRPPRLPLILCVQGERREVGLELGHLLAEFPGDLCLRRLMEKHHAERQVGLPVDRELPGDHDLHHLVERHHAKHQGDLHAEGEFPGNHCLHQLVERHHVNHQIRSRYPYWLRIKCFKVLVLKYPSH